MARIALLIDQCFVDIPGGHIVMKPHHGKSTAPRRTDAAGSIRQLMQQCHAVLKDHGCVMLLDKAAALPRRF